MGVQSYRDLLVWQKAIELVKEIYLLTKRLPVEETRGLVPQMRRASISVPSNIAEGNGRLRPGPYLNHLCIARGSLMEVESDVRLCTVLGYLPDDAAGRALLLCDEVSRLLTTLSRSLRP